MMKLDAKNSKKLIYLCSLSYFVSYLTRINFAAVIAAVISDGGLEFSREARGEISVLSLSEKALGVTLKGLLYPLENAELSYGFPLGVSNEFTKEAASVEVADGTVLVIWRGEASFVTAAYVTREEKHIALI